MAIPADFRALWSLSISICAIIKFMSISIPNIETIVPEQSLASFHGAPRQSVSN